MNMHVAPRDLTDTETRIINAAIEVILKFGPRKTTMNDIAEAAGLTRQTVYVSFGGKDNVLAETVRFIGKRHMSQVSVAWEYCANLTEKLQAYARIVVLDAYDEMTGEDDPQVLVSNHNEAGRAAYQEVCEQHAAMWAEQLAPCAEKLERAGTTANRLAQFIVSTSLNLKKTEGDKGKLHEQLSVLNASVLSMAGRR
ncbi:MAG: TetR/AcrR family transcriptional regulator [Paracoccaceae bacterium]|jgi:AcrR family transcriptional regulator|nr:TetR/AcrR family transcriptional regulator [Paracoccaceae bacterium]MDG1368825.1 TetR/AcrR family transcriptional regulator [Paracoccaceae bacterium]